MFCMIDIWYILIHNKNKTWENKLFKYQRNV